MVVQGLAGGLRLPGPPVSAQHWVEFLEHFYFFWKTKSARIGSSSLPRQARKYRSAATLSVLADLVDNFIDVFFRFLRFFKKSVKTAAPEDGRPPRALVLTKLVE